MISKFKKSKFGFSLIELIIVIAILAVLAAVLAPSLIHYVEDSREASDIHSMDEVVNAVQLGLANPEAYDEMVDASVAGNVSCYIDSPTESGKDKELGTSYYTFGDDSRLLDEVAYTAAGNMHGVTITFIPDHTNDNLTYDLKDAVINYHLGSTEKLTDYPALYNAIRRTVGDTIKLDSQTYGNSEYTIFIRIGSRGTSQAISKDPIEVYGQYNGTNLPKSYTSGGVASDRDTEYTPPASNTNPSTPGNTPSGGTTPPPVHDNPSGGSGTTGGNGGNQSNRPLIPEGGIYYVKVTSINVGENTGYEKKLVAGDPFPETVNYNDVYIYGDYEYRYGNTIHTYDTSYDNNSGPVNKWNAVARDKTKATYGELLSSINGEPLTSLGAAFANCTNVTQPVTIPATVIYMVGTYYKCDNLQSAPVIPYGVTQLQGAFYSCYSLTQPPVLPSSIENISGTFTFCSALTKAPVLPANLTMAQHSFYGCSSITTYVGNEAKGNFDGYVIPAKLKDVGRLFIGCPNISGEFVINANPDYYEDIFKDIDFQSQRITLSGSSTILDEMGLTGTNYCVECNGVCKTSHADVQTFTLNGTQYQFENGMTWAQWVASEYNTLGLVYNGGYVFRPNSNWRVVFQDHSFEVEGTDAIQANGLYKFDDASN